MALINDNIIATAYVFMTSHSLKMPIYRSQFVKKTFPVKINA